MKSVLVLFISLWFVAGWAADEGNDGGMPPETYEGPSTGGSTEDHPDSPPPNYPDNPDELSELNPFAPDIQETLKAFDKVYEAQTGISPFVEEPLIQWIKDGDCYRASCAVWAHVSKADQTLTLYVNGEKTELWQVSTGLPGHGTPNFDKHPDGRIYDKYTSGKFPGGDYKGLGNMPYAVFIKGGFAIHGTPQKNWPLLGQKASHGCIRVHPDNGLIFNRLVRKYGVKNVWITVN